MAPISVSMERIPDEKNILMKIYMPNKGKSHDRAFVYKHDIFNYKAVEDRKEMTEIVNGLKAALIISRIININDARSLEEILFQMGGGLRIEVNIKTEMKSGLGLMSNLVTGYLMGLGEMIGRPYNNLELKNKLVKQSALVMNEIRINTSWQDASSGILGGNASCAFGCQ